MNKAFEFRIYPNKKQEVLFARTFGCVRFIYNRMLEAKIDCYEETGQMLKVTPAQYKKEFEFLKEVDSLALANAQLHLETAYRNFFSEKQAGFPKYKSRKKGRASYTTNLVNGNIELLDGYLKLPKAGRVKIKQHRQVAEGYVLKAVTVNRRPSGKYYASILFEYETIPIEKVEAREERTLGLDFSMRSLYVTSEGYKAEYPRYLRQAEEKLARVQRELSRCEKGSKNRDKKRKRVARLHEKVANQRKDFLHKASRQIANDWDAVCLEDLSMKGMSQALNFGKSVADNGWGMFTCMLQYKLAEEGKQLIKIEKWYPSSKTCSICGRVKKDLKLSDRVHVCQCGSKIDRDINAALNIKKEGLRKLAT